MTTDTTDLCASFAAYVRLNIPAGTVIGDPEWWIPRLWRAAGGDVIESLQARVRELEKHLELERALNIRDGNFLDRHWCCKVCDGEIPDGHTDNCDIWKLEKKHRDFIANEYSVALQERDDLRAKLEAVEKE